MTDRPAVVKTNIAEYQNFEKEMGIAAQKYREEITGLKEGSIPSTPEYAVQRIAEMDGAKRLRDEKKKTRKAVRERTLAQYKIEQAKGDATEEAITAAEKAMDKYEAEIGAIEKEVITYESELKSVLEPKTVPAAGAKPATAVDAIKRKFELEADRQVMEEYLTKEHVTDDVIDKEYELESLAIGTGAPKNYQQIMKDFAEAVSKIDTNGMDAAAYKAKIDELKTAFNIV